MQQDTIYRGLINRKSTLGYECNKTIQKRAAKMMPVLAIPAPILEITNHSMCHWCQAVKSEKKNGKGDHLVPVQID